jgi:hypothetical protein
VNAEKAKETLNKQTDKTTKQQNRKKAPPNQKEREEKRRERREASEATVTFSSFFPYSAKNRQRNSTQQLINALIREIEREYTNNREEETS